MSYNEQDDPPGQQTTPPSNQEPPILEGSSPTEEELYYLEWGRQLPKSNLALVNAVSGHLLTLSTALLGGSIVFLERGTIDARLRNLALVIFFLALVASFVGVLPYARRINRNDPYEVKAATNKAFTLKLHLIWVTGGLLAVSFAIVFVGLLQ